MVQRSLESAAVFKDRRPDGIFFYFLFFFIASQLDRKWCKCGGEPAAESTGIWAAGLRGQMPPRQENRAMQHVIWRMMVAIEEMLGLDTSWGRISENVEDALKVLKTSLPAAMTETKYGALVLGLKPKHPRRHSGAQVASCAGMEKKDDLIILVFMDHWAAGLDFFYWIMGNSFFLLKEWLPNPIRPSAVLGVAVAAAVTTQTVAMSPICSTNTMHKNVGYTFLRMSTCAKSYHKHGLKKGEMFNFLTTSPAM